LIKDASGNVGIGTASPYTKLDVNGVITVEPIASGGKPQILLGSGGASYGQIQNDANGLWSLGYGGTSTALGTPVLKWDSSGNLGLGVTPSAWYSAQKAIDIVSGSIMSSGTSAVQVLANAYFNASGVWTYKNTNSASRYYQSTGVHVWDTAPSGTAGNAITFTTAMTLDTSGNLTVAARGAVATGAAANANHGLRITGSGITSSNNGGFFNVRMVTLNGDGGNNTGNTFVSNLYGTKGVCIAAFNSSGDSVSPSTFCPNSNLCTFVALVSS
jgi:hypothetical protein